MTPCVAARGRAPFTSAPETWRKAIKNRGGDECLAEVADGLPVGHGIARSRAEEGAKAFAVGDLEAGGIVGQAARAP